MTRTQITAKPGMPLITVTRDFDAPPELVFRAQVEPELVVQWLGPRDLTMKVECWEVRDGGRWRYAHTDVRGETYLSVVKCFGSAIVVNFGPGLLIE